MAIKFELVKAGDTLYDVHSERAGNTTMRRQGCWSVYVISVDPDGRGARVSWNSNPPEWRPRERIERLRRTKPNQTDRR